MIAPAMPVIMGHNRTFLALFGLAVNTEFNYPKYFAMQPTGGPTPKEEFARGFFAVAMATKSEADDCRDDRRGRRVSAQRDGRRPRRGEGLGLKIVYDKTYPPTTSDYSPIVRAIQATNPDIVMVASYPPDSVGMIRAANEVGLKTKLFGGGMVGLQSTAIKVQLGPLLNGIVDYDFWLPWSKLASPAGLEFLKKYQAEARIDGR